MKSPMINKLEISWLALPKKVFWSAPSSRSSRCTQLKSKEEKAYPKKQHMEQIYTLCVQIPNTTRLMITGTQSLNASSTLLQYRSLTLSFQPFSSKLPLPSSMTYFYLFSDDIPPSIDGFSISQSSWVSLLTSMSEWVTLLMRDY